MAKTVYFIRHGRLKDPFDDYEKLSFENLQSLSKGIVEPEIDEIWAEGAWLEFKIKFNFADVDTIFASESLRTWQTAKLFSSQISVEKTSFLNEILFDVGQLVTEKQFKKEGLSVIRKELFKALLSDENIEGLDSIWSRMEGLRNLLKKTKSNHIICFTHGFYMRFFRFRNLLI